MRVWQSLVRLGLILGLLLGLAGPAWGAATPSDRLAEQQFFNHVWQIVNRAYLDPDFNHQNWYKVRKKFNGRKLESRADTYRAIEELLASLDDPYTRFLPPDRFATMTTSTAGSLTGVGLQIAVDPETATLVVISPIEGSPAEKAQLQPLDRIVAIDGVSTAGLTLDECAERMRGELGSKVRLTVVRNRQGQLPAFDRTNLFEGKEEIKGEPQGDRFEVELIRDTIRVNPVVARLNQDNGHKIGYIRLSQFNGNAAAEVAKAIREQEAAGAEAYVLDLRGNPGGLLAAGIEIARLWMDEGPIVYTVDRQGIAETYRATGSALTHKPLAVLVNGGSASASEVVSGALQDSGRAILVGTRTYGKGLIQSLFTLEDQSGLAVTVGRYETPNHRDINKVGIAPDREVPLLNPLSRQDVGTDRDEQYRVAAEWLTQRIAAAPGSTAPTAEPANSPAPHAAG
ncbi:MAG: S41 family peptidase [Pseudanabaenaceae cyanobacterium]